MNILVGWTSVSKSILIFQFYSSIYSIGSTAEVLRLLIEVVPLRIQMMKPFTSFRAIYAITYWCRCATFVVVLSNHFISLIVLKKLRANPAW